MPQPPNILWICSDQQRWDTLGYTGNTWVTTPNLDRLATEGALLSSVFSQSTMCAPSRAGFLTGRYPRTTRLRQNGQALPRDEMLVTKTLAEHGYTCGLVGKLHLAACAPSACPGAEPRGDDGYAEFHWAHDPESKWAGSGYTRWLRELGVPFRKENLDGCRHVQTGMPEEHQHTTWCVDRAADFVSRHADDREPWLLSVNLYAPHHPFNPPAERLARYLDRLDDIPLPVEQDGQTPRFLDVDRRGAYGFDGFYPAEQMSPRDHRLLRAAYWAMVDMVDAQIGRLLVTLDDEGLRDNTLVLFHSDHGELLGDHGAYLKGPHFHDAAIRVPFIARWPGFIPPGLNSDALVELDDVAPTVLEAAGLPPNPGMQARTLMPLLLGDASDIGREDVYCEYYNAGERLDGVRPFGTMVRTREHKLSVFHGTPDAELYDLEADPDERHNLWDAPGSLALQCAMLRRLCDKMAETVDPLPLREATW